MPAINVARDCRQDGRRLVGQENIANQNILRLVDFRGLPEKHFRRQASILACESRYQIP